MQSTVGRVAAATVVLGLVACQGEAPTSSDSVRTPIAFAIGEGTDATPVLGMIKVCKSESSNVDGTFTFTRTTGAGSVLPDATIEPNNCIVVAEDNTVAGSNVTTTETSAFMVSVSAERVDANNATPVNQPFTNGGSLYVNAFHGFTITYVNHVDEPTAGNNGCSPGYYKNHAFPDPFTSSTTFLEVFGNDVYGDATLLTVLKTGGGGLAALGRQTVAAYFNATIYSDFGYSPQEVIDAFNAAVAGTSADQTTLQNEFAALTDVDGRICTNPTGK